MAGRLWISGLFFFQSAIVFLVNVCADIINKKSGERFFSILLKEQFLF